MLHTISRRGFRGYGGLKLVPPVLVPAVRQLLASQGINNPHAISDSGEIDPMSLIALGFDKMTVHTAFSPPITINLTGPKDPQTEALLQQVQPAITFSGRAGTAEVAPYGVPESNGALSPQVKRIGWSIGAGLGAALLGVLLFGGALFGRRRQ